MTPSDREEEESLFAGAPESLQAKAPLAARMRPANLDEIVGQQSVIGPGTTLRALIEKDELRSAILWGPAGTGKTTIAHLVAERTKIPVEKLSAISAGVADVRKVIANARKFGRTLLFLDEIHRFNRAQQDAFLGAVEEGLIILIGATTENPFFEVNSPLLSRSLLFRLESLEPEHIKEILNRALRDEERGLPGVTAVDDALDWIAEKSGGDARIALNALEASAQLAGARGATEVTRRRRPSGLGPPGDPLRQGPGPPLRRDFCVHQVLAGIRSRRCAVLAVRDARRRGGPEVRRAPDDRARV